MNNFCPVALSGSQMHKSNSLMTQHRWIGTRYAGLDTRIQSLVVKLLDRELSGDGGVNRNSARRGEQDA
jgi:hypothetical protein